MRSRRLTGAPALLGFAPVACGDPRPSTSAAHAAPPPPLAPRIARARAAGAQRRVLESPDPMASPKFDRAKAIRVLLDALVVGDETACAQHKISRKTLTRYRARLANDPELSAAVQAKGKADDLEWGAQRRLCLAEGLRKLRQLISEAGVAQLPAVANAVKVVGELQVAASGLGLDGDERAGADREGGTPPAPSGGHGAAGERLAH